ncbi:cysteine synthase A [uncultured Paraglaciecola sp.]|uniref:cysteine synthase A n=1 Tax=uncultured Paraglaciecola sp. TaxID=1765024 RepID=UPI0030D7C2F1|tara:strand:+ start:2639 stop:3664 length:1026 start_codon:yes stop_codon:yes gene_type:complete
MSTEALSLAVNNETNKSSVNSSSISAPKGRIYDDITQTIGNTPLVRLSRLAKKYHACAEILAKVEYFNPAGSIKDRPALAMINALMQSDSFNDDTQIIEATSGNNGVACAWICAMKAIPLTIVIPEHMSIERQKLIKHYGANVITTAKELGTKGAIDKAKQLVQITEGAVMLDQFGNQANPDMHFNSTAQEIWRDTDGEVDVLVAGVGTGGTITGIAKALKIRNPNIKIIAVEPASCPVLSEGRTGVHKIQGLSSGHVPDVLDVSLLDEVITVSNEDSIIYARELARVESLPVGISSGAAACAAINIAKRPEYAGKNIVTILADTAERYFSTELFAQDEGI